MSTTLKMHLTAVLILLLVMSSSMMPAQSPFGESAVKIQKISESSQSATDTGLNKVESAEKEGNIFKRIGSFIKTSFKKIASVVKNRNTPGELPSYISRAVKIPGHDTAEFVFQGICQMPMNTSIAAAKEKAFYRYIILSYYPKTDKTSQPSQLVIVDSLSGQPVYRFALYLGKDKPYTGHAGGITAVGRYLWVASGYNLYGFDLQQIINSVTDKSARALSTLANGMPPSFKLPTSNLVLKKSYRVDSSASYVSFDGKYIWVGDFVKSSSSKYGPVPHHGKNSYKLKTWIAGYRVDDTGMPTANQKYRFTSNGKSREGHKPDRIIFCRESVQGFALSDKFAALSISYGASSSKLAFYKGLNPKNAVKHTFKPEGQSKTFTADAWVIDSKTHLTTLELPAGSEDLEFDGKVLYVGFEGASPNYRAKWTRINPLLKIEDRFYLIAPKKIKELGL